MDGPRSTRLYGAAIAFASGGYSIAVGSSGMSASSTLMVVLGLVVVLHGALLLTDRVDRLGDASGPLMIGYALVMLANQAVAGIGMGGGMAMGMMDGAMGTMGWDLGMVTLALLMFVSGLIMTTRHGMR